MDDPREEFEWRCPSCCQGGVPEVVEIRDGRGMPWRPSTIQRCPKTDCHHTFGGTLEDTIKHLDRVYDYKYFGDYPLDPEQLDAVLTAWDLARRFASSAKPAEDENSREDQKHLIAEAIKALRAMFDAYEDVYDMAIPTKHQSEEAKRACELASKTIQLLEGKD